MEIEKPSFETHLWGQCNKLHERLTKKIDYYKSLCKAFKPIANLYSDLNEKIKSMKMTMDPTIPVELYTDSKSIHSNSLDLNSKWYSIPLTMNKIKEFIENTTDINHQSLFNILNNLEKLITKMKQEKTNYEEFLKSLSLLADSKKSMEKKMKEYHTKMYAAEQSVLDLKKLQIKTMSVNDATMMVESKNVIEEKANQLTNDCVKPFKIYQDSVDKANEMREQSINKQKNLLYTFQEIEEEIGRVNTTISYIFYSNLKFQKESIEELLLEIDKIRNSINTTNDIKQLILNYAGDDKPEEKILFINFPSVIDFDKGEDNDSYRINAATIEFIKSVINDEYPLYDPVFEEKKNEMREITTKLFTEYSSQNKEKLLNFIKNKKMHYYFLIVLSKLRTNNRFQQKNQIIDLLGDILNDILKVAENDKLYENAKNCVILSQTFYYEENNVKHYLLEKIVKNKWLTSVDFWTNFIDKMIDQEINKFLSNHLEVKKSQILNGSDEINDKMKLKISELLFSQLLPYVNNMNEFKLDLKSIVYVTEFFCEKYKFLGEEHQESIYGLISDDKAKIEKFRNEYKKDNNKKININFNKEKISSTSSNNTNKFEKNINKDKNKSESITKNININSIKNTNNNVNTNNNNINKSNTLIFNNKNSNINKSQNTNINKTNNQPNNPNLNTNSNNKVINTNKINDHNIMQNEILMRANTFKNMLNNKFISNEINNKNSSINKTKIEEKKEVKKEVKKETKKEEASDSIIKKVPEKKKTNPQPINNNNNNNSNPQNVFGVTLKKINNK